jgi:hypothetical protein
MAIRVPTAVLVVTTLPEQGAERARVLCTQDVNAGEEVEVVVDSLTGVLDVVEAWWLACRWRSPLSAADIDEERES